MHKGLAAAALLLLCLLGCCSDSPDGTEDTDDTYTLTNTFPRYGTTAPAEASGTAVSPLSTLSTRATMQTVATKTTLLTERTPLLTDPPVLTDASAPLSVTIGKTTVAVGETLAPLLDALGNPAASVSGETTAYALDGVIVYTSGSAQQVARIALTDATHATADGLRVGMQRSDAVSRYGKGEPTGDKLRFSAAEGTLTVTLEGDTITEISLSRAG